MHRKITTFLLLIAALALLAACSDDEDSALREDGNDDPCLNCHGDQDLLMSMLPDDEARPAPVGRGDG